MKTKTIFENWRRYLSEGMKMPEDLPRGVYVTIEVDGKDHYVYYSNKNAVKLNPSSSVFGMILLSPVSRKADGECLSGMVIAGSEASKGWGPLLYDVAIEHASTFASGLMSDRNQVSPEAYAVWDYYLKNRSDVTWKQLDNPDDELTPGVSGDNCFQDPAEEAGEDKGMEWSDENMPLSKMFIKKEPTMTNRLEMFDKLIKRGI
jgi:hypothetical protein